MKRSALISHAWTSLKESVARVAASMEDLSPDTAALILALGLVLGMFPIYGCPTILCALASLILGLNLPGLQLVNQLVTPLQLALVVPFLRVGSRLVNVPASAANFAWGLGTAALQAVAGWLCIGVPLGILSYFTFRYMFRRAFHRQPTIWSRCKASSLPVNSL